MSRSTAYEVSGVPPAAQAAAKQTRNSIPLYQAAAKQMKHTAPPIESNGQPGQCAEAPILNISMWI